MSFVSPIHPLGENEQAVYERARQATRRYWQYVPAWPWGECDIDRIIAARVRDARAGS